MSYLCTEDRFLETVKDHQMKVLRDNGVERHIQFRCNGRYFESFELITWPGHLMITGDYGTYVFCRIEDMFAFFRTDGSKVRLPINPRYWGEKLLSVCKLGGFMEFSEERFKSNVIDMIKQQFDGEDAERESEVIADVEESIFPITDDGMVRACDAVIEYKHENGFQFIDAWDWVGGCNDYTYHYIWCLYAIVWGIQQYDKSKESLEVT